MQELAAVGYGRLSIEAIARRAGVSKTAIYRRWSSKLALVLEIVSAVAAAQSLPLPDTGSLRGDLEMLFRIMARALQHRLASQIIPDLLAEAARNADIAQTLQEALRTNQQTIGVLLIDRAIDRGELSVDADPNAVFDLIVGPIYWRLAIARTPLRPTELARMAVAVAAALAAAAEPLGSPSAKPSSGDTTTGSGSNGS